MSEGNVCYVRMVMNAIPKRDKFELSEIINALATSTKNLDLALSEGHIRDVLINEGFANVVSNEGRVELMVLENEGREFQEKDKSYNEYIRRKYFENKKAISLSKSKNMKERYWWLIGIIAYIFGIISALAIEWLKLRIQ